MNISFMTACHMLKWMQKHESMASFGPANPRLSRQMAFLLFQRQFAGKSGDQSASEDPSGTSIEEEYSRKTPIEHVLLRPGMYVGANEKMPPQPHWILDQQTSLPPKELLDGSLAAMKIPKKPWRGKMVKQECEIVPALVKIFDEILVNASDNRLRHPKSCTRIDVIVDPGSKKRDPVIRVFNDGKGIPVRMHQKEKMYVPELVFGHLLTGSNFDDSAKRVTGGRHGYGAKLTNIFSKSFTVEVADSSSKKLFTQTWTDNMTNSSTQSITSYGDDGKDYTCISFVPDLERLTNTTGATVIGPDDYAFMCRRVIDVAGCTAGTLQISLNGMDVSLPSFESYMKLYPSTESIIVKSINKRWSVGVALSAEREFESVSFVNGVSTPRGGTHVNAIANQIIKQIQNKFDKNGGELAQYLSPQVIRKHLFVGIDALIENPTFDSQMKEKLTTSPSKYGSSYDLPKSFFSKLLKKIDSGGPGLLEEITRAAERREKDNLKKSVGNGRQSKNLGPSIAKLEDAHQAGSKNGWQCTIILTEGDSAKALAVAGLEVIGRKKFGVYPLRGKFLNVRNATTKQLATNSELKDLCTIMGLEFDKEYKTIAERRSLRYGKVMLMADQDKDGKNVKSCWI